jgi:hypothetical protein
MTHERVRSSNVHSMAHSDQTLEVRFNCNACRGDGVIPVTSFDGQPKAVNCGSCHGTGHTGTYRYVGVPKSLYDRVLAGDHGFRERPKSVGVAFNVLIRGNPQFKGEKL